jgi:exodeoxyribonuclease VII large subunit
VAGSRIPTIVAIGHEVDISLGELAADRRASTPSNAAEMLVPDKKHELAVIRDAQSTLRHALQQSVNDQKRKLGEVMSALHAVAEQTVVRATESLSRRLNLLEAFNPTAALRRGYAVIRTEQGAILRSGKGVLAGDVLDIELTDATITTKVKETKEKR